MAWQGETGWGTGLNRWGWADGAEQIELVGFACSAWGHHDDNQATRHWPFGNGGLAMAI
jgi:hypothetical protein